MNPLRKLFARLAGGLGVIGFALFFLAFSCAQKLPTIPQGQPISLKSTPVEKLPVGFSEKQSETYAVVGSGVMDAPEADTVVGLEPDALDFATADAGETVAKSVGPSGYTIKFPIGTKDTALLVVPDGALDQNWNLSLRASLVPTRDEKMSVALYEFFPDGLVYLKDCYLIQPSRYPDGTLLALSWYDPKTEKWVQEEVARVQNGRAIFVIKHFSTYGAPYDGDGLGSGGQ